MAATEEQIAALRSFVGAPPSVPDNALGTIFDRAAADVGRYCGTAISEVPADVLQGVTIEVSAELFHRRSAPNGISQFADASGNPVRVARDPMVAAYRELAPYVGLGIG